MNDAQNQATRLVVCFLLILIATVSTVLCYRLVVPYFHDKNTATRAHMKQYVKGMFSDAQDVYVWCDRDTDGDHLTECRATFVRGVNKRQLVEATCPISEQTTQPCTPSTSPLFKH
jgi:hypothetical protein